VAVANDHLMIGNLITNAQGMLTHTGQDTLPLAYTVSHHPCCRNYRRAFSRRLP
jgi:hypothetical protein